MRIDTGSWSDIACAMPYYTGSLDGKTRLYDSVMVNIGVPGFSLVSGFRNETANTRERLTPTKRIKTQAG